MAAIHDTNRILAACWGKLAGPEAARQYHPLIFHLLDVALSTEVMWSEVLPRAMRARLSEALGLDERAAARWIAFLAGTHDVGKLSPAFQCQEKTAVTRLRAAGLSVGASPKWAPHGTITACVLPELLRDELEVGGPIAKLAAIAVGGHHGLFPTADDRQGIKSDQIGGNSWKDARRHLINTLATLLGVPRDRSPAHLSPSAAMALAGLVSVADWIGSNAAYFPIELPWAQDPPNLDLTGYVDRARSQAHRALDQLGWLGWTPQTGTRSFGDLFPNLPAPNHTQHAVVDLAPRFTAPGLVIVEAPMGEGKTEAAFYLADAWAATLGQRGCYVALPTQATSNQMFGRLSNFLSHRFPADTINLQLLHGHASLQAEFQVLQRRGALFEPTGVAEDDADHGDLANILAAEWFTYRKRGLLAPFGVGTVDQALLAVLQTKHAFVRLFGLANKTVIIDEVHAYDTYMSTLLDDLLAWLGALGSSVVLLSATLPTQRQRELVAAYGRGANYQVPVAAISGPYPRLTWLTNNDAGCAPLLTSPRSRKALAVRAVDGRIPTESADFELGAHLYKALQNGGCAAVICNTVLRAQQVYLALRPYFPGVASDGEPTLDLLHARFPATRREELELRARARFGPPDASQPEARPDRAVLVATQVIEQSLDLDFDLMVTDLAPIDLMLQRAGRLHRHTRNRPSGLETPQLWITGFPTEPDRVPVFDSGTLAVYDRHVILRTWIAVSRFVAQNAAIRVPEDVGDLIELVYGANVPCPPELGDEICRTWAASGEQYAKDKEADNLKAKGVEILQPDKGDEIFEHFNAQLDEEDPTVHQSLRAATRLGRPSLSLILLDPTCAALADLKDKPTVEVARQILQRSVAVSHPGVVHGVPANVQVPTGWKRSPLLRWQWPIRLDDTGSAEVGRYRLHLEDKLGLTITRLEA